MSALTQRMAAAPHVSWRALAVLALLVLALVSAALYAGSQQRRLPAPFGPAANGVIPYVSNGDLYAGDPITGESRLLVGGPEGDALPQFSPDGTRVAFMRDVGTTSIKPIDIYVAGADGSDPNADHAGADLGFEVDLLDTGRGQTSLSISKVDAGSQPARPVRRGR